MKITIINGKEVVVETTEIIIDLKELERKRDEISMEILTLDSELQVINAKITEYKLLKK